MSDWSRAISVGWLLLGGLVACESSAGPGQSGAGGAGIPPGDCGAGLTSCAGGCFDLATHPVHCGACGRACGTGQICSGGACLCQEGLSACGVECVNLANDGDHCGACGRACPDGSVCSMGECTTGDCASGTTLCGSSCVLLASDPAHCGGCNQACGAGQSCVAGSCVCSGGEPICAGQCTDPMTDPAHCGGCGIACPLGSSCVAGSCSSGGSGGSGGADLVGGSGGAESGGSGGTAGIETGGISGGGTGGIAGTETGGISGGGTGGTAGNGTGGISSGGTGGTPATFRNPLNSSHGSDPYLVYYEGYYYLAATTWGTTLTMKRGRTVAELKAASPATIWSDSTPSRQGNMWAPEFYLIDGPNGRRWYHYYTAGDGSDLGTQRSHVLESEGTDPMGPYHYQGQLLNYWAIDGSLLEVGTNRYFLFSSWEGATQNSYVIAMTNPWTVTGNRTRLTAPTYPWEQEGSDSVNEGPVALYHGGRTFVAYSASQCADPGYKLGLLELTGSNPLDAGAWWKSPTPVFQAANGAYGSAHNGFFTSPDGTEDWIVYHATTNSRGSCWTDRTTRIQRFTWKADGMPDFGEPLALSTDLTVPSGE